MNQSTWGGDTEVGGAGRYGSSPVHAQTRIRDPGSAAGGGAFMYCRAAPPGGRTADRSALGRERVPAAERCPDTYSVSQSCDRPKQNLLPLASDRPPTALRPREERHTQFSTRLRAYSLATRRLTQRTPHQSDAFADSAGLWCAENSCDLVRAPMAQSSGRARPAPVSRLPRPRLRRGPGRTQHREAPRCFGMMSNPG